MDYKQIKTERQFKSSTGYSKDEFNELYKCFAEYYLEKNGQAYEIYVEENVTEPPIFNTLDRWLFFVLFQLKNDMLYDSLGAVFGMNGSTANTNFKLFLKLLEGTLKKKGFSKKEI